MIGTPRHLDGSGYSSEEIRQSNVQIGASVILGVAAFEGEVGFAAPKQSLGTGSAETVSAESATLPTVPQVTTNKLSGDAIRDVIAAREAPALIEQNFNTVGGYRRIDVLKLTEGLEGIESKVGRTALGSRERQELARDWWLLRQGQLEQITWEFTRSPQTGAIGPIAPLLQKLQVLGIQIRINP